MNVNKNSSPYERADEQGAVILPPRSKQVIFRVVKAQGEVIPVPRWALGRWCTLTVVDGDAFFITSPEVIQASLVESTLSNNHISTDPKTPFPIFNKSLVSYFFEPNTDKYISIMGEGKFFMMVSSPDAAGK